MQNTDTPPTAHQTSFLPLLDRLSSEALEAIRREEIIDEHRVCVDHYHKWFHIGLSGFLLGFVWSVIWFALKFEGRYDISFFGNAWPTGIPVTVGFAFFVETVRGPARELSLLPIIGPGKL